MHASTCRALGIKRSCSRFEQHRFLAVLAWGRNAEGQCGAHTFRSPLVVRPEPVVDLDGQDIVSLAAGSLNSAAIARDGSCFTWGSGKGGKLGHGSSTNVYSATRVESFVGRTQIGRVALGLDHSLFLDRDGSTWSCGENKEGQCGFGTSLDVLAKQRRQEWHMTAHMATFAQAYAETLQKNSGDQPGRHLDAASALGGGKGGSGGENGSAWMQHQQGSSAAPQLLDHSAQESELRQTREMVAGGLGKSAVDADSHFGSFGGSSSRQGFAPLVETTLGRMDAFGRANGLMPGQHHTPMRVGRDEHDLFAEAEGVLGRQGSPPEGAGIGSQRVVDIAASNHFSMLLTECGEVYTCGGGFNGELGQSSSWLSSASQVEGHVRQALADNGGATAVACGSTFSLALTASGRVVVWGGIAGCKPPPGARRAGGVVVAEVMGLPRITRIAAGRHQAILSDGERVWTLGTWMDRTGRRVGTEWGVPQQLLGLPADGIRSVSAGARASAAVTEAGELFIWGRLIAADNARALVQQMTGVSRSAADAAAWMWEGMGGDDGPQRVPGLPPVHSVHLGAAHVIALVH